MIGAVTTGLASTQATASSASVMPASSAMGRSWAMVANSRSCQ